MFGLTNKNSLFEITIKGIQKKIKVDLFKMWKIVVLLTCFVCLAHSAPQKPAEEGKPEPVIIFLALFCEKKTIDLENL